MLFGMNQATTVRYACCRSSVMDFPVVDIVGIIAKNAEHILYVLCATRDNPRLRAILIVVKVAWRR